MGVMRAAAESLALPCTPIAALVCPHSDAVTFNALGVADNRQPARIARRHCLIARIVSPKVNGVGSEREQFEQPHRIRHMVEDARSDHEVKPLRRLLQKRHEIAKLESRSSEAKQLLDDQASQK